MTNVIKSGVLVHKSISPVTFTTQGALGKSALRQANERLVLNAIREHPWLSRAGISRITGLSPSSVTFIVQRLAREKLIQEGGTELAPRIGRPATNLRLTPGARLAIGVELRSAASRVALADWTGQILDVQEVGWQPGAAEMLHAIRQRVQLFLASRPASRFLGVGLSAPGTWDRGTGTLTSAVNLGWQQVAVQAGLAEGLNVPFYFDNNANLSALGERWFRSAQDQGMDNFVFVTLSGGLGTGILVGGQVLHGAFGRAGEFGHMTTHAAGRRCLCGNRGCWEEYASDRALVRLYGSLARTDGNLQAQEIARLALKGDAAARRAIREVSRELALGLANLILGLNPETIVLDSWAALAWDLVEKGVWAALRARVPEAWLEGVRIRPSSHAEDSSLLGAIALVLANFFHSFEPSPRQISPTRVRIRRT
ncbi:MAG: ROK family transcriptional regulator [Bryobacteraceae bacterium]|nr:ROK family transcriptional regulator [Bryobacteraceae bacterium]MDW8378536.1 ROK family transcriptional regulator [Bryobacterales bacterium]